MNHCFALLDDCTDRPNQRTPSQPARSRLYTDYLRTLSCDDATALPQLLADMQSALAQGAHAVALFAYELGAQSHGIVAHSAKQQTALAEILLFKTCRRLNPTELDDWLDARSAAESDLAGIVNLRADVDRSGFDAALARIHAYIETGDCYQINYTYRLHFEVYGSPLALYRRLRARQPTPYGALIALPDGRALLSCSPELFMHHSAGVITAQPMKGTAAACGDAQIDAQRATALAADPKNRAENLMIVDLLRNDLGRIAQTGSVQTSALFAVHNFNGVLQMTSTVRAQCRPDLTLSALIAALYPCGSIIGAPKHRAMQIIQELEHAPRAIYTGALGWFEAAASHEKIGDFCLSVTIRTLALDAPQHGMRHAQMGVGAGIVHDSIAAEEFAECQLKAAFLTSLTHHFQLFETLYLSRSEGCRHLQRHLQRLGDSAARCGFAFDRAQARHLLQQSVEQLNDDAPRRLRLTLTQQGEMTLQLVALKPLQLPVKLLLSTDTRPSDRFFLAHKTTDRAIYDRAWQQAEHVGAFDALFVDHDGSVSEGGRSNLFVQLQGRWYTPPLSAGVLPGIMRAVLLSNPGWDASERHLTLADLRAAEQIMVCNALRGALPALIDWQLTPPISPS